ncbi:MAG: flagellar hook-length control protein FliK [Candidatus Lokiarchaeota archaeon]|nr:flagellar hook-length control protein FliK [Candidatus Lokiarchaeota archaeon]
MIEQVMKSNILHEASSLLKKQNKENYNDNLGASFEDLFTENNTDYLRKNNDNNTIDNNTIIITFEDNQNNFEKTLNETDNIDNYLEKENFDKEQKEINKISEDKKNFNVENINSDKIIREDNKSVKNINKDQINQNINSTKLIRSNNKLDKNIDNKESLESINIKLRYGHIELKSDLDFKTKQKIKSIMNDLKSGKIDTNIANAFISQLIRTSHINGLKTIDKKIKVQIKDKQNKNEIKDLNKNDKSNDLNLEKSKNVIKNNNFNQFSSSDSAENKTNLKVNDKLKINNKDQAKSEDVKLNDIKSEIKLEIYDNKNANIALNKDVPLNTKETLEVNKQKIFQQVSNNTKIVLTQNQTKFSTMIRPENFGRIDFQFVVKDGKVNGKLILQNQEVVDFFKSNVEELRAVMQKSNVELENIEIILAGNRFGEFSGNQQNNNFVNEDNNLSYKNNIISKNIETFEENNSLEIINYSKRDNSNINILI